MTPPRDPDEIAQEILDIASLGFVQEYNATSLSEEIVKAITAERTRYEELLADCMKLAGFYGAGNEWDWGERAREFLAKWGGV